MTENNGDSGDPSNLEEALLGSFNKGSHVTPEIRLPSTFSPPSASLAPKVTDAGDQGSGGSAGSND